MRPNLLLILVDSAQAGAYRLNGGQAEAPALERLAAEGVNCARAWSTTPICHPARAALITGCFPHTHGMATNAEYAGGWPFRVREETPPLPALLQQAGYRTGYAGQLHIDVPGWDADRHESTVDFMAWLRARGLEEASPPERRGWMCGPVDYSVDETREGRFCAQALSLLDEFTGDDAPWFLQLDFDGPHPPCWLPEPYASTYDPQAIDLPPTIADDLSGRPDWVQRARRRQVATPRSEADWRQLRAHYYGSITMIDSLVGRVLDRLDQHGQAANTVVVFTSDHATPVGYHGFPMHGGPALYEEVLRVPFVCRWPDGLPAGATRQHAVQQVDYAPTMLAAAGLPAPPMHGRSVLAGLRGEPADWPDQSFHSYHGTGSTLFSVRAWRDGDAKLIYTPYAAAEVYDLAADPLETVNLCGRPEAAELERGLRRGLLAEMERVGDPLRHHARADLAV